jgi:hypothetical protein
MLHRHPGPLDECTQNRGSELLVQTALLPKDGELHPPVLLGVIVDDVVEHVA